MADINTFSLNVITPEKTIFSDEVATLTVHGADGYLGVLPHHAPLITSLERGPLKITKPDESNVSFSVNNGFMEIRENKVVILAGSVEKK